MLSIVVAELSLGTAARSSCEVRIEDHDPNRVERHHYNVAVLDPFQSILDPRSVWLKKVNNF